MLSKITSTPKNKSSLKKLLAGAVLVVLVLVTVAPGSVSNFVGAASDGALRRKSQQLQAEINAGNAQIKQLEHQAATLSQALQQITGQVNEANAQIAATQRSIEALEIKLVETQTELERQKGILRESMRTLYMKSGASPVEMLVSSENFSQYMDEQEYLDRLKTAVQDSAERIVALEEQIKAEKVQQEKLREDQNLQRNILAERQREQQSLLDQTQGEEARYQSIVADREKQYVQAQKDLAAELARGNLKSQGFVNTGDVVGRVGSTGYSTGPHIHFQVFVGGSDRNPLNYLDSELLWPLPNSRNISQYYGCVAEPGFYSSRCTQANGSAGSFHNGLDIADRPGNPIVASAPGNIVFRGCRAGLGYVVAIDHGNDMITWYPHQTTPSGQVYGYC